MRLRSILKNFFKIITRAIWKQPSCVAVQNLLRGKLLALFFHLSLSLKPTWRLIDLWLVLEDFWMMGWKSLQLTFRELFARVWRNLFSFLAVDRWCEKVKNPLITTLFKPLKDIHTFCRKLSEFSFVNGFYLLRHTHTHVAAPNDCN